MFKKIIKSALALTITIAAAAQPVAASQPLNSYTTDTRCPVLVYHNIISDKNKCGPWSTTPEKFEADIKSLLECGYTPIFTSELVSALECKSKLPEKPVIIQFDDGYSSVYNYAAPILKKYNVKAEVYILTDVTANEPMTFNGNEFLSWQQLRIMQGEGLFKTYLHGKSHKPVTEFSTDGLKSDFLLANSVIDKNLSPRDNYYVYPSGKYNQNTLKTLSDAGCPMQFVWIWNINPELKCFNAWMRINVGYESNVIDVINDYNSRMNCIK